MTFENEKVYDALRAQMVEDQLQNRGIKAEAVVNAMKSVPRHLFVPEESRDAAYEDRALPIGPEQTISQPYIVGLMLQDLNLKSSDSVLEIGTGTGYEAAVLAEIVSKVFTVEIDPPLLERAERLLTQLGYKNITFKAGDGLGGWKDHAPFDKIVVSAAPHTIPRQLVRELKVGGRMILPLGDEVQILVSIDKGSDGLTSRELGTVRFVEMKGGE